MEIRTASVPEAVMVKEEGSKERETTWASWNWPRSATSMPEMAVEPRSVLQENVPVVEDQRRREPVAQLVSPEPKVLEAEAWPMMSRSPETETLAPKSALPVVERVEREVNPTTLRVEPRVVAPEMEAVPPTSREESVDPPALMPSLVSPVNSKLEETETPLLKVARALKMGAPVNVQAPEMVWAMDREAGPLV